MEGVKVSFLNLMILRYRDSCNPCICSREYVRCIGRDVTIFPRWDRSEMEHVKYIFIENTFIRNVDLLKYDNLREIHTTNNLILKCSGIQ